MSVVWLLMGAVVVAVDGAAGSGKSSVSRGVAIELGLGYLDTGAMYRAMALGLQRRGVDVGAPEDIAAHCGDPVIAPSLDPSRPGITLDGFDVSAEIRTAEVTEVVSAVSAVPGVRERLVDLQRTLVARSVADGRGLVVEGRDIGTVVLPDADLKVFLVADPEVRARRRAMEDRQAGRAGDVDETAAALAERDRADSGRAVSPLRQADGAVVVDGTHEDLPTVIARVADLVTRAQDRT